MRHIHPLIAGLALLIALACALSARASDPVAIDSIDSQHILDLARNGWYDQALTLLQKNEQLHPGAPGIAESRLIVLSMAGRHTEAAALTDSLQLDTASACVRQAAAASFRAIGRLEEAESFYIHLRQELPDNAAIAEGLAMVMLGRNRIDEAKALINAFPNQVPRAESMLVRLYRDQAAELSYSDHFADALNILETLRIAYPDYVDVDFDILAILSWSGQYEDAARLAESLPLERGPDPVLQAAAMAYRESGKLKQSERLYRDLLARHPDNPIIAEGLILTIIKACNLDQADRLIAKYKSGPENMLKAEAAIVMASRNQAADLAYTGKNKEALALLRAVDAKYPGFVGVEQDILAIVAWTGSYEEAAMLAGKLDMTHAPSYIRDAVAKAYRETGRLDQAESLYRDMLALEPGNADIAGNLALTLVHNGQLDEAKTLIERYRRRAPALTAPAEEALLAALRDKAIDAARSGDIYGALATLTPLVKRYPDNAPLLGDYVTVLSLAGRHAIAAEIGARLNPEDAPEYALSAYASSLRHDNRPEEALEVYRRAAVRFPRSPSITAGLAMTLVDLGQPEEGETVLDRFIARFPSADTGDIDSAWVYLRQSGNGIDEVVRFGDLSLDAQVQAGALRRLQSRLAGATRESDADYQLTVRLSSAGQYSAWTGEAALPHDLRDRQEQAEVLQQLLDDFLASRDTTATPEQAFAINTAKVRVFYELGKMRQAVQLYETLGYANLPIPDRTLLAAGGAYLALRCPALAKDCYLAVLARENGAQPPSAEQLLAAKKGLFWALLENEELDHALAQADTLYLEEKTGNAGAFRSLAYVYAGFMGKAEIHAENLVAEYPESSGALSALATVNALRGLPRTANEYIQRARQYRPDDIGLATQNAGNSLAMRDWRSAQRLLAEVQPYAPYVNAVRDMQKEWDIHNSYELRIDVSWARVTSGVSPVMGTDDAPSLETRLFSKPFASDWRVFGGAATRAGDFDEGYARQNIYSGGLEYRSPLLTATLEVRADKVNDTKFGMELSGAFTPDDHWRVPFSFELCSRQTPLRARQSDITAKSASTGVSYYWNESRSFNSTVSFMDFSDDNRRLSLSGDFTQRLWNWFNHYIDGTLSASSSWNSRDDDRPYFNPKRDVEFGGTVGYGNILWRRYDVSLAHRLTLGLGNYWQRAYGSHLAWGLGYSHSWVVGRQLSFNYGAGYGNRVHDGDSSRAVNAYLSAVYRF